MKKAATIFLIFTYALSSTGFALKADYCCNKLQSVRLVLADDAKNKEGCCKVKYQTFKIRDVHAVSHILKVSATPFCTLPPILTLQDVPVVNKITCGFINIHAPPLISSTPVYISNCVFRI